MSKSRINNNNTFFDFSIYVMKWHTDFAYWCFCSKLKTVFHFGSNFNKKVPIQYTSIASSYSTWWKRIAKRKYYYFFNEITHCSVCTVWRRDVSKWKYFQAHLLKNKGGLSRIFTVTLSCNKQHYVLGFLSFHFMHLCDEFCIFFFAAQLGQDSLFEVIFEFNHTLTLSREVFYAFLNVTKLKQLVN